MTEKINPRDLVDLDQLRRAVVALALEPARIRQLNAGERLLARGLVENYVLALDRVWHLLPDRTPFSRIEAALETVESVAGDEDWVKPAFIESEVWNPVREAANAVAEARGWSLAVDPFDDLPVSMRRRRGRRRKRPNRRQA